MKNIYILLLICTFSLCSFSQNLSSKINIVNPSISLNADKISPLSFYKNTKKKKRDFTFNTNLYLWTMTLNGKSALPIDNPNLPVTQTSILDVNLKFSDAVKYLKFAFMIAGAFSYKNISLLYDISYAKLKFDGDVPVQSGYVYGALTSEQFVGDVGLGYVFPLKNKKIRLTGYAGIRISSLNNKLDFYYANNNIFATEKSKTWIDPLVGAGVKFDIAKHWLAFIKGDAGGFGASSKFTGSALGAFGYKFTPNWNTTLGFKYLYTDYDKDNFLWKASTYGIILSFGYVML